MPIPPKEGKEAEKDALNKLLDKIDADGPVATPFNVKDAADPGADAIRVAAPATYLLADPLPALAN